ncbi:MAG: hypothetical protein AB8G86_15475 [Saprospiraceae bacterium]
MKIAKIYYYAFRPVLLLLGVTCIRYLLGNKNIFTIERIFICIIGGLMLGTIFLLVDIFKNRLRKTSV